MCFGSAWAVVAYVYCTGLVNHSLNGTLETRSYFVWQGASFLKQNWEPPEGREPKAEAQDGSSQLFRPRLFQKKPKADGSRERSEPQVAMPPKHEPRRQSERKSPNGINQRFLSG